MASRVLELPYSNPAQVFAHLQHLPYALFLDSADQTHTDSRYSFICAFPAETIEAKNGRITVSNEREQTTYEGDPFAVLKDRVAAFENAHKTLPDLPPFQGGAAGFFGYDLGRGIEDIPNTAKDTPDMIDMAVGLYDQVLAFDHERGKSWLITHGANDILSAQKQQSFLDILKSEPETKQDAPLNWSSNFTQDEYENAVDRIIDYIYAGDIFQANLSQRFDAQLPQHFCAYTHYMKMRETNAAPFAGFMNLNEIKISSASPERFLRIEDKKVETRPIKGTAPRHIDPIKDKQNRDALENSEKDRAENTMIVDLLRNDLSKSCEADSIEVKDLCKLESFARVHHLVSTVTGELRDDQTPIDLLRACFPGGSITGAPKIRAMEIIEELEPSRRGPYCGSMGYIGFDGTMDTNILIRTLVYHHDQVSFQVGGGIVADSDHAAEYQETLDKADAIFQSFETSNETVAAE